ncbi:hypothetical protein K491DRAFT_712576 [Lophiostoma macrostomum CBS 122681]|uniref:Uncharacterized protein n=1 Tax=Lophiostoma macrostomum CBS 122681 TaxID=1314788 RepID=A0A6A6TK14_9PLEO|nr:hypothetical protein K491DRAFT_712576 [Lophiostoma macrostomum CBS 122681]
MDPNTPSATATQSLPFRLLDLPPELLDIIFVNISQKWDLFNTSTERSGLDLLLLTEALRGFTNLSWVNVNPRPSRFSYPSMSELEHTIMCGLHMFRHDDTHASDPLWVPCLRLNAATNSRSTGIVSTAMEAADLDSYVTLDLDLSYLDELPESGHFDITSELWKKDTCQRVWYFGVLVSQQLASWSQDVLWETSDLRLLRLRSDNHERHDISFSHYANGPFRWPHLHTLGLEYSQVPRDSFREFLAAHKDSLSRLGIFDSEARENGVVDVWQPIFQSLRDLDLDDICFRRLHSRRTQSEANIDNDGTASTELDTEFAELRIKGNDRIYTAMQTLLDDYQTSDHKNTRDEMDVLVDMRKAKHLEDKSEQAVGKTKDAANKGHVEAGDRTDGQGLDQGAT